ncbi:MAG: transglycosylase SLT domain-containing protein [Acidobacteria bacterium]|nr:transglycosylase SLT domain-containing protein [Acidobacteriota bacterium]
MRSVLAMIALSFVLSGSVFAETADEHFRRIRDLQIAHDTPSAINELRSFIQKYPEESTANDLDHLLARMLEDTGGQAEAMALYAEVHARRSLIGDHALWRMSQIARGSGNFTLERIYLSELEAFYPESILLSAADRRSVHSYFDSRDHLSVIAAKDLPQAMSRLSKASFTDKNKRSDRLMLGYAELYNGNASAARDIFEQTIEETRDKQQPDGLTLEAVRGLDALDAAASLSDLEHKRRAWVYQFNRDFGSARLHYRSIVNDHPSSDAAPEAVFQLGRGHFQENAYSEAVLWFERLIEQYPENELVKPGLLQLAGAYSRSGRSREGVSRYHTYVDRYPDDEQLDRAYMNPIDTLRDYNSDSEALRRSALAQDVFRGKTGEAQALFTEARIYLSLEKWDQALDSLTRLNSLSDLGGARVPGGTTRNEVMFLTALCQEMMQRFPEAIETYLSIPDGRDSYYGMYATRRLRGIASGERSGSAAAEKKLLLNKVKASSDPDLSRQAIQSLLRITDSEEDRQLLLNELQKTYKETKQYSYLSESTRPPLIELALPRNTQRRQNPNPHAAKAQTLSRSGLADEAAVEYEAAGNTDKRFLAEIYTLGDRAYRGIEYAEPFWQNLAADHQIELLPADAIRLLYPTPYREDLINYSTAANVDPRFLLAIMRQESRFRPDAVSSAAASGLMQFIIPTAARMAQQVELNDFTDQDLFDPGTSILFGATYTGQMFRQFINQPDAVAAGYNGGEENMQRWMKRSRSDQPERFVAEIQYAQTKDYVQKVMSAYRVYTTFYNEQLILRPELIGENEDVAK